jgi:hypothetical protein
MSYVGNTNTTQAFTPAIDYFSGNGSTVAFTLSRPVASVAQVQVVVNNVDQNPTDAFTVLNNTITFTGAPSSGTNNIYVYYTSPITQVIQPGQGTVTRTSFATGASEFASGTKLLFQQTSAPTGWTKDTSHDNKALRVVSGAASSGGSVAFTTAFASQAVSGTIGNTTATNQNTTAGGTVNGTTLTEGQLPSHRHYVRGDYRGDSVGVRFGPSDSPNTSNMSPDGNPVNTSTYTGVLYGWYTGNGESHNHSFSGSAHSHTQDAHNHSFTGTAINLAVQYVDVILAAKD